MVRVPTRTETTSVTGDYDELETVRLVDRAASGNYDAFGKLYGLYLDRIFRYVFYRVGNRMLAEDITEDVFLKAWKSIRSCKGRGRTFLSWLYRIAHNHVVDTTRNRYKEGLSLEEIELFVDNSADNPGLETGLEWQELSNLVATLPHNQEQVIVMKFFEGMDNGEIGKVMGKSQGAIRVLQMRALATLRRKLVVEK
jgi:RNA polymerase sigma-70 factor (ECF subfamily)